MEAIRLRVKDVDFSANQITVREGKGSCKKGSTVLGAQASSPARVPSNQQPLTELLALDAGRRGRLRSQDRGAFCKSL